MRKVILFVSLCVVFFGAACDKNKFVVSRPLIGTIVNLTMYTDSGSAVKAAEAAFAEIRRLEQSMSMYEKESDIARINAGSGRFVAVTDETIRLISQSLEIGVATRGAFDISFASIAHLWKYKSKQFTLPDPKQVKHLKKLVNFREISIHENRVKLNKPGMKIGLGGIAKGYVIKRAVHMLQKHGVTAGIVEAGGDLQVFGSKGIFDTWRTGVMHPRKKSILMVIDLDDMDSIATSGDYERVVMYKGKRYHHIIDPRTGYPTDTFASVSVICKDPVLADAYATALFVLGLDKAKMFLAEHTDIAAVFIDMDMNVYASGSLKDRVEVMKDSKVEWF